MIQGTKLIGTVLILTAVVFSFIAQAQAQTPQETLKQYISDLQKNPNDYALQEKIIKHVQTMKPRLTMPEEAKKYMVRGKAAFKGAKETKDFNDAASEFQKALLIAPWLAEGYYNLGIVQDKAGQHNAATQSLKLYLVAAPNAADAEKVKELMYEIEYRQEKAAKESNPQAIAEKKRQSEEDFIQKLNGVRYVLNYNYAPFAQNTLDIRGNKIIKGTICRGCTKGLYSDGAWHFEDETTLNGHEFSLYFGGRSVCDLDLNYKAMENGKISDDGNTITTELCGKTIIYRRER